METRRNSLFESSALLSHGDQVAVGAMDALDACRHEGAPEPTLSLNKSERSPSTKGTRSSRVAPGNVTATRRSSHDTRPGIDKPPLLDEGFDRAQRLASGCVEADDVAWLRKGFSAFLAAGGALPLERCLGLPRNDCALRRACRDYWLRVAWHALDDNLSPWRRSEKLAAVVSKFRMGQWARWRTLESAPILATEIERALYEAFRAWERVPQTAMQLHNIAHHRRHS